LDGACGGFDHPGDDARLRDEHGVAAVDAWRNFAAGLADFRLQPCHIDQRLHFRSVPATVMTAPP